MTALIVNNLSAFYQKKQALYNISFTVNKNDFLGIIGPNGGGKTTLFRVLLGLNKSYSGTYSFAKNFKIGYVPQKESFINGFPISVHEVILSGSLPKQVSFNFSYSNATKKKAQVLMKDLKIYELRANHIGQLSGGELQKVLIARALISDPDIIFLDEPTSNIDLPTENEIFELLKKINCKITIVVISHNLTKIADYANKIAVINKKLLHYQEIEDFNISVGIPGYNFYNFINRKMK